MKPRDTFDDDFDELHFTSEDDMPRKGRRRHKGAKAAKRKRTAPRIEYEFEYEFDSDDDFVDDNDVDYDNDDWRTSYNPPYRFSE